MRQLSIIILSIILLSSNLSLQAFSAIKGRVNYSIPIDYSKLSETELADKAKVYFFNAIKLQNNFVNEDMTNALFLYSVLEAKNPENLEYPIKLGILYDKLDKDRHAKGSFSRAILIDKTKPESYYYLGEFYYRRKMYRRALKYYNESYKNGFNLNYDLLFKIGDIYEKFGDSRSALKYLKEAESQVSTPELTEKIKRIENFNSINKEYYTDTRIRN